MISAVARLFGALSIAAGLGAVATTQGFDVPGAPQHLQASVAGNLVTLQFEPSPAGGAITGYIVEAGSAPGLANLARLVIGANTSFQATAPSGIYYVRVRAQNTEGEGAASNEIQVRVGIAGCSAPPGPPGGLTATVAGHAVHLSWAAPTSATTDRFEVRAGSRHGDRSLVALSTGINRELSAAAPDGIYYVAVVAVNECGTSPESNEVVVTVGTTSPGARSLLDRPDDLFQYQVKIIYALPSDGVDEELDVNGTIARSVESFQRWLERQTGKRLVMDTFGGELDITFVRLMRSNAAMMVYGAYVVQEIERELASRGFGDSNKAYAIYYGGGSTYACGGAAWPPDIVMRAAAMYLKAAPSGFATPCTAGRFASNVDAPEYWEFAMLHDLMHVLGFVARCAPNHTLTGHTGDTPLDLMYSGPQAWRPALLDWNHDDYYRHGRDCLDLANSIFLTPPDSGASLPPRWPFDAVADMGEEGFGPACRLPPPQ